MGKGLQSALDRRLIEACIHDDATSVHAWIGLGADPTARDLERWTPLHFSARRGDLEACLLLLSAGANPNDANPVGWTPLHLSACKGHADVALALLDSGAEVNALDTIGCPPLHVAAHWGHVQCLRLLMDAGADIELQDHHRKTARDLAIESGMLECEQMQRVERTARSIEKALPPLANAKPRRSKSF